MLLASSMIFMFMLLDDSMCDMKARSFKCTDQCLPRRVSQALAPPVCAPNTAPQLGLRAQLHAQPCGALRAQGRSHSPLVPRPHCSRRASSLALLLRTAGQHVLGRRVSILRFKAVLQSGPTSPVGFLV